MLKITAIGNLTNDVELKVNETTGKPYAILPPLPGPGRQPAHRLYLHQGTRPSGGALCGVRLEGLQAGRGRRL